jgi:hypothetical protein
VYAGRRGEDAVAEEDDREQPVALGDVVRVPADRACALGPQRDGQLAGDEADAGCEEPPFRSGEDSLFFETFNSGKRSVSLDLPRTMGAPSSWTSWSTRTRSPATCAATSPRSSG